MNILIDNLLLYFFIFETVKRVSVKIFDTNALLFFVLLGLASPLKTLYMSVHNTKKKATGCSLKTAEVILDADKYVIA